MVADVYQDAKRFLPVREHGGERGLLIACRGWRSSFFTHRGQHATSALRALYWLLRRPGRD